MGPENINISEQALPGKLLRSLSPEFYSFWGEICSKTPGTCQPKRLESGSETPVVVTQAARIDFNIHTKAKLK